MDTEVKTIEDAIADGELIADKVMNIVDWACKWIALAACILLLALCEKSVFGWLWAALWIVTSMVEKLTIGQKNKRIEELEAENKKLRVSIADKYASIIQAVEAE